MKNTKENNLPTAEFRFAKHILVIGLVLLPILAIIDYKSGYVVPTVAKSLCLVICVIGIVLIRNNRYEKAIRISLGVALLLMSMTGAFYKLDSYYSLIWVPVLPVLFAFLVGVLPGIILSFIYLAFYCFSFFSFESFHGIHAIGIQVWLTSVMAFILLLLVSVFFKMEKQKDESKMRNAAEIDYLTQIPNRHGFMPRLSEEIHRVNRYDSDLSLMLIDIDRFKRINDEYGHPIGDQLLTEFATLLLSRLRSSDVVARWGGEEFIILTPETDLRACTDLAEILRNSVETHQFANVEKITASFGVTQYIKPESDHMFIARADELLYRAKKQGRNRVMFSHSKYFEEKSWEKVNFSA